MNDQFATSLGSIRKGKEIPLRKMIFLTFTTAISLRSYQAFVLTISVP